MTHRHLFPILARRAAACCSLVALLGCGQEPDAARLATAPAAAQRLALRLEGLPPPSGDSDVDEPWNVSLTGEYAYLEALATHAKRQVELGSVAQKRAGSPLVRDLAYGLARHGAQALAELEPLGAAIEMYSPAKLTWRDQHHLQRLRRDDLEPEAIDNAYLQLVHASLAAALVAAEDGAETCQGRRRIAAHARRTLGILHDQADFIAQVEALRGSSLDAGGALGPVPGDEADWDTQG